MVGVLASLFPKQEQGYQYPLVLAVTLTTAIALLLAALVVAQISTLRGGPRIHGLAMQTLAEQTQESGAVGDNAIELLLLRRARVHAESGEELESANDARRDWLFAAGILQLFGVLALAGGIAFFLLQNIR